MRVVDFEGTHLRVWTCEELSRVENVVDPAGVGVGAGGALTGLAEDRSPVLPVQTGCHPQLEPLLRGEYHKDRGLLVLRCHFCRKPVLAVYVL